ncbi:hypothetical protein PZB75_10285 [Streptomyces sp. AM 4-1-1]|uniref:hypothetical protein n=1 Tax=Streptomyces sp. AM 4-1-1 TaxID=3028710 RepID=UPI0023B974E9|nr:hypothetical protein [Streptomyces sp. AM 4-1-1]WEH37471.1 hypothetical protein PZB75_10285 [Streptomyces sp. AM 4-1-1]
MSAAAWRVPMCCDFGQHAAVVERLSADLLHPSHPMADLPGDGSPYYSPYAVFQGLVARATGLAGRSVVLLSGPVNLIVLLTGIGRFTRLLSPSRWAPVLALAAMVLLWGTERMWWSGSLGLMSMTGNLPYPSTFAIGLAFHVWAWTGHAARLSSPGGGIATGWVDHAGIGVLLGLVLLIHPISSVGAVVGVVALVVGWQRDWTRRVVARWALTGAVAVVVAGTWPYFDAFALVGDSAVDRIHRVLYEDLVPHYWLVLPALPALWLRWRADRRDPLVLMFVLDAAAVTYGWFSGHYTYGRLLGLTLVPAQFALAVELAAPRPWPVPRRVLAPLAAVAAGLGFVTAQGGAVVPRALDPLGMDRPMRWETYDWAAAHIPAGDVVLTDSYRATRSLAGYGPYLVAPPWPDAALAESERQRRVRAVRAYLDPSATEARRERIAARYGVRWLLLTRDERLPRNAVVVAYSTRTGEVLARLPGVPPG